LVDFSAAYGNNLSTYYTLFGVCSGLIDEVLKKRDPITANALMDSVTNAVSTTTDLQKCSDEFREALKQLNRSIIDLCASKNYGVLEDNVEAAYSKTRKLTMEIENMKRDLAIERSTLQQLSDTSLTDNEIQENIKTRIQKELETVKQQQSVLETAIQEDGKKTTRSHHVPYCGWRWWYYGGGYSYTTTETKDTKSEQNLANRNISDIEDRVNSLKHKLETQSLTRSKRLELTRTNIEKLQREISEWEERRKKEMNVTQEMENKLTIARCQAAGCDDETSRQLADAFKLTLPLFMQLADTTSQVSTTFNTVKSVITATNRIPVQSAITVYDAVIKMAIGDFIGNNSLTIGNDNQFTAQMKIFDRVYNDTAIALQQFDQYFEDNS